jgi:hypothetical protein
MSVKKILCALCAVLTLSLSACGDSEKNVLNYEQPLSAMKGALGNSDEISYMSCFLPQAKAKYMQSESYSSDFIDSILDSDSVIGKVSVKVTESTELSQDELSELEGQARENYGTRFDFTKGQRLDVDIAVYTRQKELSDSRELTVVRYENVWYIYGDVIDSFSFSPQSSKK